MNAADAPFDAARLTVDDVAWDAFVAASPRPSYLQATPWASAKRANGWSAVRIVTDAPGGPVGAQVLHRRARPLPWRFGYAARGPIAARSVDAEAIEAFTAALRRDGPALRLSHVRIDPEIEDLDGAIATALRSSGWREVAEVQPQRTRQIELLRDESELWSEVKRKWRQNTSKVAREGSRVESVGRERLAEFVALHRLTAARAGIPPRSSRAFEDLWDAFAPSGHAHLLVVVDPDGSMPAAQLVVGWGGTAAVLYSGITDEGQRRRVNYLLKWEAIRAIRALGYATYDLWGLPTPAIEEFKTGWGGQERRWIGAWDLTLSGVGRAVIEGAIEGRSAVVRVRERLRGQRTRRRRPAGETGAAAPSPGIEGRAADGPAPDGPADQDEAAP